MTILMDEKEKKKENVFYIVQIYSKDTRNNEDDSENENRDKIDYKQKWKVMAETLKDLSKSKNCTGQSRYQ